MIPVNADKFFGCEMIMPETVFYLKGKAQILFKLDKNFCLKAIQNTANKNELSNENVYKMLSVAVRDRKQDRNGLFTQVYLKQMQLDAINRLKQGGAESEQATSAKTTD